MDASYPPPPPPFGASDVTSEGQSYAITEQSENALNRPFMETSYPPPKPPLAASDMLSDQNAHTISGTGRVDDSEDDESGVELSFQPEDDDDMSSLGCSLMTKDFSGKEPDGYKSDDVYTTADVAGDVRSASSQPRSGVKKAKKKRRQQRSERKENHLLALEPVEESSVETESLKSPKNHSPSRANPEQTIEDIMNRGVEKQPPTSWHSSGGVDGRPQTSWHSSGGVEVQQENSWHSSDKWKVNRIVMSFNQSSSGVSYSDSSNGGGPPTVEPAQDDDEAVNRTLQSKSFFSNDNTMADSCDVFST
jgi:hypothetical protein